MVSAALGVGVAFVCCPVGVRVGVVNITVDGLGVTGGRGTRLVARMEQMPELAARNIAVFCVPVVTGVPGDGLQSYVQAVQEVE